MVAPRTAVAAALLGGLTLAGCQPRAAVPPAPAPVLQPLREAEKAAEKMDAATRAREQAVQGVLNGPASTP